MGLRDEIQADIAEAFDTDLADAVQALTGLREVEGVYNPKTGKVEGAESLRYSGRGVFGSYKIMEVDGQHVLSTDSKLTALQNELFVLDTNDDQTAVAATPSVGDHINGYRALDVAQDPSAATWTIQLREK